MKPKFTKEKVEHPFPLAKKDVNLIFNHKQEVIADAVSSFQRDVITNKMNFIPVVRESDRDNAFKLQNSFFKDIRGDANISKKFENLNFYGSGARGKHKHHSEKDNVVYKIKVGNQHKTRFEVDAIQLEEAKQLTDNSTDLKGFRKLLKDRALREVKRQVKKYNIGQTAIDKKGLFPAGHSRRNYIKNTTRTDEHIFTSKRSDEFSNLRKGLEDEKYEFDPGVRRTIS